MVTAMSCMGSWASPVANGWAPAFSAWMRSPREQSSSAAWRVA